jgi:hypothetical protein
MSPNSNVNIYKSLLINIPRTLIFVSVNPPGFMVICVFLAYFHV